MNEGRCGWQREITVVTADPVVAAGHAWELIVIVLLIVLMVTKPF